MKKFYKSKMFWFNLLAFIVAIAGGFGYVGELSPDLEVFVLPVIAIINVILRFVTREGIEL